MRILGGGAIGAAMFTLGSAAAWASSYSFTVPYSVTLPSGYNGTMTLAISCAVGGSALTLDPAQGAVTDGAGGAKARAARSNPITLNTTTGWNRVKDTQSQFGVQGSQLQSESQSQLGAQSSQSSANTYTGTTTVVVPDDGSADSVKAALAIGGVAPTNYLCWGIVGTNNAYVTPPLVKGTLPTAIR